MDRHSVYVTGHWQMSVSRDDNSYGSTTCRTTDTPDAKTDSRDKKWKKKIRIKNAGDTANSLPLRACTCRKQWHVTFLGGDDE